MEKGSYVSHNSLIMDDNKKIYICLAIVLALVMAGIVFWMYKTNFVQHLFGF